MNSSVLAFDFISKDNNIGGIDTESLFGCVGVAITCTNENTVNNNVNTNNGTNPPPNEPGTLTVTKEVQCGTDAPNPEVVCEYAKASANFPDPEDYQITVTGNNPNPSNFAGSPTGTTVTLGEGDYTITESEVSTCALQQELNALAVLTQTRTEGNCDSDFDGGIFQATGQIFSGGSQEFKLINTIMIY